MNFRLCARKAGITRISTKTNNFDGNYVMIIRSAHIGRTNHGRSGIGPGNGTSANQGLKREKQTAHLKS